jgi:hypothetical protein
MTKISLPQVSDLCSVSNLSLEVFCMTLKGIDIEGSHIMPMGWQCWQGDERPNMPVFPEWADHHDVIPGDGYMFLLLTDM